MIIDLVVSLIRKNFYIISFEKYKNTVSDRVLERYGCKHPLLTPEIIVLNDQPHGFKRLQNRLKTLEKFPIFCEIEYLSNSDDTDIKIIDYLELFSEFSVSVSNQAKALTELSKLFEDYVQVDRVKTVGVDTHSSIVIYSKLNKLFYEHFFEQELDEGTITEVELNHLVAKQIKYFTHFIKCCDEIFIKKKKLSRLDPALLPK